ncbi:hypothetical protein ACSCB1_02825 [Streptomyces europaeiscabiei]|nr:hypothetical protein [Streptomyces europaeiscabiei]MDX3673175.1 hypothetical protein [Streptomyces europaeiscabiei]
MVSPCSRPVAGGEQATQWMPHARSEQERAALAEFHAHGGELAVPAGEFDELLLADYIVGVPDGPDRKSGHTQAPLTTQRSDW